MNGANALRSRDNETTQESSMTPTFKCALALAAVAMTSHAAAQITFYQDDGYSGRSFTTRQQISDFNSVGFNDRASSVVVLGNPWEVCEDARFSGRCVVLRQGQYPSLSAMGLNDRVSSVRAVNGNARIDEDRYAPAPTPAYDNRRRGNERLYQAEVVDVRAVLGPPEQRCWVEREQVSQSNINVPGALIGAVIGGVLGHQVGGGVGKDVVTVGGAVAGGAVGANVGRGVQDVQTRDVQRCENSQSQSRPAYWDVTYTFRGQAHQMQMTAPPGATVTVNAQGEPRA
jgi:uncharacterized protein YcfJ